MRTRPAAGAFLTFCLRARRRSLSRPRSKIATFLASDGHLILDPDGLAPLFETPIGLLLHSTELWDVGTISVGTPQTLTIRATVVSPHGDMLETERPTPQTRRRPDLASRALEPTGSPGRGAQAKERVAR